MKGPVHQQCLKHHSVRSHSHRVNMADTAFLPYCIVTDHEIIIDFCGQSNNGKRRAPLLAYLQSLFTQAGQSCVHWPPVTSPVSLAFSTCLGGVWNCTDYTCPGLDVPPWLVVLEKFEKILLKLLRNGSRWVVPSHLVCFFPLLFATQGSAQSLVICISSPLMDVSTPLQPLASMSWPKAAIRGNSLSPFKMLLVDQ